MAAKHDHEMYIGTTRDQFTLVRNDDGSVMYKVIEEVPNYQRSIIFSQNNWSGGHGQFKVGDPTRYFEGQSIDFTRDGRLILAPLITEVQESDDSALDSAPICFFYSTKLSKIFCATAGKIYRLSAGKWLAATTAVSNVNCIVEYNGILYASRYDGTTISTYMYSSDGDTWAETDLTDEYATYFFVSPNAAGTQNVLWKLRTSNELAYTTDGREVVAGGVQWSSPAYIGDTSANVVSMFLANNKLMIGKFNNLFNYDSAGGVHALMDELRNASLSTNFKYLAQWQSSMYFSLGSKLGEIGSNDTYNVFGALTGEDIDDIGKVGTCVGLTSDVDNLYAAFDEGTNSHIYKGRQVMTANGLRWCWTPFVYLGTNACSTIYVAQHSSTDRRLWFGYGTKTGYVTLTDDPTTDSTARFCAAGWCRMSYIYGSDPNWDKMVQSAVIETANLAAGITVQIKYHKDADTSATECVAAYTTNGLNEKNFTNALSGKRIQFEIHLASGTNTVTPIVSLFYVKGFEKPTTIRIHEAYYSVGDKPTDRAKTIRDLLRTARTSTSLIKFADLRYGQKTVGTSSSDYVWVVVQPGFPQEIEVKHEKGRQPELALMVRLQEVSFTIS